MVYIYTYIYIKLWCYYEWIISFFYNSLTKDINENIILKYNDLIEN